MGSTGSGSFTDYPGSQGGRPNKAGGSGDSGGSGRGGGGGGGGKRTDDRCGAKLDDISLQDVANCIYFREHQSLPPKKSRVRIRNKLLGGRVAVEIQDTKEPIGLLPTKYNYVVACMKDGWEYAGSIVESSAARIPKIIVSLIANRTND
jgi:hypothetical protein